MNVYDEVNNLARSLKESKEYLDNANNKESDITNI